MLAGYFIHAVDMGLGGEYQAKGSGVFIQKSVPQIHGDALQSHLLEVVKPGDAADIIRRSDRSELCAEVLDRHKFQFGRFCQRAVAAGALSETSGRLTLKFPFTDFA